MPKNQDALFRQWHMLRRVPRYPQKITVQDIRRGLAESGFDITERSIQRDLNGTLKVFHCPATTGETLRLELAKDAASFDLPGLSVPRR
ncbi:MAG: hypothetical protein IPH41_15370 [Sulfuritalea sp.]|nr:hypothetical protein [Sulfuritalea sp.]